LAHLPGAAARPVAAIVSGRLKSSAHLRIALWAAAKLLKLNDASAYHLSVDKNYLFARFERTVLFNE
jgi:hypothetical protein